MKVTSALPRKMNRKTAKKTLANARAGLMRGNLGDHDVLWTDSSKSLFIRALNLALQVGRCLLHRLLRPHRPVCGTVKSTADFARETEFDAAVKPAQQQNRETLGVLQKGLIPADALYLFSGSSGGRR